MKKWGVLPGPPFEEVKIDAAAIGDEPVDFTTATVEAFTLWRESRDCRQLAEKLILECAVLQVGVTPSDITAWWPADAVRRWLGFDRMLPVAVETVAELAHALDGREGDGRRARRKCGSCSADITRYQAFCANCGKPWWEPTPGSPQTTNSGI